MSVALVLIGQVLALALGAAIGSFLVDRGPGARATVIGYGYFIGLVAITLVLRLLSALGVQWSFAIPALVAAVCAGALFALKWRLRAFIRAAGPPQGANCSPSGGSEQSTHVSVGARNVDPARARLSFRSLTDLDGIVFAALLVLIGAHVGLAFYEAALRPLFPWDATTHWATKARVWYELRGMVPFVDEATWLRSTGGVFTDAHPDYPGTVPLFQTWVALAWGSWDDATVNISWPLSLAALAAGVFGQMRRLDMTATLALAVAYAITSLPFIDVHAALAGYADLAIAVNYCFAFTALAVWTRTRRLEDALLALLCAAILPMLKAPGWIWVATLVPGFACVLMSRRVFRAGVILAAAAAGGALVYVLLNGGATILGYIVELQRTSGVRALLDNLYAFASWHILWLLAPLLLFASGRRLLRPNLEPLTIVIAAGITFLLVVFFLSSSASEGVEAYTTVNRALLHLVPALIVYCALVLRDLWPAATKAMADRGPTPA